MTCACVLRAFVAEAERRQRAYEDGRIAWRAEPGHFYSREAVAAMEAAQLDRTSERPQK